MPSLSRVPWKIHYINKHAKNIPNWRSACVDALIFHGCGMLMVSELKKYARPFLDCAISVQTSKSIQSEVPNERNIKHLNFEQRVTYLNLSVQKYGIHRLTDN